MLNLQEILVVHLLTIGFSTQNDAFFKLNFLNWNLIHIWIPRKCHNHGTQPSKASVKDNIGIRHGFSCINIRKVPWEVLKTEAEGRGFQHLARDMANANALINHVRSLLLHKH